MTVVAKILSPKACVEIPSHWSEVASDLLLDLSRLPVNVASWIVVSGLLERDGELCVELEIEHEFVDPAAYEEIDLIVRRAHCRVSKSGGLH